MRFKGYVEIFIDCLIGISTVGLERLHVSAWLIDLITEGVIGWCWWNHYFFTKYHYLILGTGFFGRQWIYGTCRVCDE